MTTARLFALNIAGHPEGGSQIGMIAKRTYRVAGGQAILADEQLPLVEELQIGDDEVTLVHDLDIALNRTAVDVIVKAKARASAKERVVDARVRVGMLDRRLRLFGDRRVWRDSAGHIRFDEPKPIEEIDLDWAAAYGGADRAYLAMHGDPVQPIYEEAGQPYQPAFGSYAYPRNRVGKGYVIEPTADALELCALPNLEDPAYLLSPDRLAIGRPDAWPSGLAVAGLSWLSYVSFPRCAMLGIVPPFDNDAYPLEKFFEVAMGVLKPESIARHVALPQRMDIGAAQQSAVEMRLPEIALGAPVELDNLHPQWRSWRFAVPAEYPAMALQMPDAPTEQLEPRIRTLLIEPENDRLCVVWVGEHRSPTPVGPGKAEKIQFAVRWR